VCPTFPVSDRKSRRSDKGWHCRTIAVCAETEQCFQHLKVSQPPSCLNFADHRKDHDSAGSLPRTPQPHIWDRTWRQSHYSLSESCCTRIYRDLSLPLGERITAVKSMDQRSEKACPFFYTSVTIITLAYCSFLCKHQAPLLQRCLVMLHVLEIRLSLKVTWNYTLIRMQVPVSISFYLYYLVLLPLFILQQTFQYDLVFVL